MNSCALSIQIIRSCIFNSHHLILTTTLSLPTTLPHSMRCFAKKAVCNSIEQTVAFQRWTKVERGGPTLCMSLSDCAISPNHHRIVCKWKDELSTCHSHRNRITNDYPEGDDDDFKLCPHTPSSSLPPPPQQWHKMPSSM